MIKASINQWAFHSPEKRREASIARDVREQGFTYDLDEREVALNIGTLKPLEREIDVATASVVHRHEVWTGTFFRESDRTGRMLAPEVRCYGVNRLVQRHVVTFDHPHPGGHRKHVPPKPQ